MRTLRKNYCQTSTIYNRNVQSVSDSPSCEIMRSVRKAFLRIRQQFVARNGLQKPSTCTSAILMRLVINTVQQILATALLAGYYCVMLL